jgi:SAM-dependent methyltransferase
LARGFRDISVLDLSDAALHEARTRVGDRPGVRWLAADVLAANLPSDHYGLWHDRAVFHFLTWPEHRERYVAQAARSVREGGFLILSTFAPDGPEQCSGLPVCRYDAASLAALFAGAFERIGDSRETHQTPFATEQPFTYLLLRRTGARAAPSSQSHPRAGHATD